MYPLVESIPVKPAQKQNAKSNQLPYIQEKLQAYLKANDNIKDRRLLECHAHCFISLS